jgi:hypothetical protein
MPLTEVELISETGAPMTKTFSSLFDGKLGYVTSLLKVGLGLCVYIWLGFDWKLPNESLVSYLKYPLGWSGVHTYIRAYIHIHICVTYSQTDYGYWY